MWDFDFGRTLGIMFRTWPFIALRLVVYFGITLAYVLATGTGAGVGYGVGNIFAEGGPEGMAFCGGIVGFAVVSIVLYWIREYILYVVKAGHIAVMVHLIDGREVPGGQGQIAYARQVVTERFAEANILFVMDQLVKGAIRAITGLIGGIAAILPIPGLQGLVSFLNTVIRLSLTYVDEIILGYNIRLDSRNPFETARQGVVLYAQNGTTMVKNAVWLSLIMWVLAFLVFLFMLAPAAAMVYWMPGALERLVVRACDHLGLGGQVGADRAVLHRRADAGLFQGHRGPGAQSRLGSPPDRGLETFPRPQGQGARRVWQASRRRRARRADGPPKSVEHAPAEARQGWQRPEASPISGYDDAALFAPDLSRAHNPARPS